MNSEFQKNLENDDWREYALRNSAYRPGHPARNFSIGSRETLNGTTREELLAFHQRFYSANRMTLALTGPAGLDRLEPWRGPTSGRWSTRSAPSCTIRADYLPRKAALRILRMEPVKDLRRMTLELPAARPARRSGQQARRVDHLRARPRGRGQPARGTRSPKAWPPA